MDSNDAKRLPFPIPRFYPELERIGTRKEQLDTLIRVNLRLEFGYVAVLLLLPLSADWFEARVKTWFGVAGQASDLATVALLVLVMLAALSVLTLFGTRHARKKIRAQLVKLGHMLCIECGYDVRGQTEPRCPECGTAFIRKTSRTSDS